jgi:hypothetical protein
MAAGDMGRTEQAYFQVDGPMVAFLDGDEGVTVVDTAAMETRCTLPGPISSYLLRDGRAFLLKQRSVLTVSTRNCKTLWRYRTADFVVLSMEFAGEVLHLSGMQTGNGEPLEWWEEFELSSGQQIERSRRTPATYTPPPWRRSAWAPSGDVVGLRGEILQGLDTRRSTAHAVAADPLPRNPSAVDAGAAAEQSAK